MHSLYSHFAGIAGAPEYVGWAPGAYVVDRVGGTPEGMPILMTERGGTS